MRTHGWTDGRDGLTNIYGIQALLDAQNKSGTWLLSILWTLLCSPFFFALGWLLAGYRLAIGWLYTLASDPQFNLLTEIAGSFVPMN